MKKAFLFFLLVFSMLTSLSHGQSNTSDGIYQLSKGKANEQLINGLKARQKALKNEQRALQNRIDSVLGDEAMAAVKDTAFTLEADKVVLKYGQIAYVNSNTNFVSVNKGKAIVQVAFNVPFAGPNGIGGVTVQGSVSGYEIQTDKKGNTLIKMNVLGVGISAQLWITMHQGSHDASVQILPNFNSEWLTLNGVILPTNKSTIFKGMTL